MKHLHTTELHVHLGGCITPENVLDLVGDFTDVDWTPFRDAWTRAFPDKDVPDLDAILARARTSGDVSELAQLSVMQEGDRGDFLKFQVKFELLVSISHHAHRLDPVNGLLNHQREIAQLVMRTHREGGMKYIEYRAMYNESGMTEDAFKIYHRINLESVLKESCDGFTARYIVSLPRGNSLTAYKWLRELLDGSPELWPACVGLDFCHIEEGKPPKIEKELFEQVRRDNARTPQHHLDIVYHVGESFFDKSIESAIRWCHEAAVMGAYRLGHAVALGLDPEAAISRRSRTSHMTELVSERLDQIAYDIQWKDGLSDVGVHVDIEALQKERTRLESMDPNDTIARDYTPERLAEILKRQDFVLSYLISQGTVIESCPTSNVLIGGIHDPQVHPLHKFLHSGVNLAISTDDPGIFGTSLEEEVEWVRTHCTHPDDLLLSRLGDPYEFRAAKAREGIIKCQ